MTPAPGLVAATTTNATNSGGDVDYAGGGGAGIKSEGDVELTNSNENLTSGSHVGHNSAGGTRPHLHHLQIPTQTSLVQQHKQGQGPDDLVGVLPLELLWTPDALRECSLLNPKDRHRAFAQFIRALFSLTLPDENGNKWQIYTSDQLRAALDRASTLAKADYARQVRLLERCRRFCFALRSSTQAGGGGRNEDTTVANVGLFGKEFGVGFDFGIADESKGKKRSEKMEMAQMLLNGARDAHEAAKATYIKLKLARIQLTKLGRIY